MEVVLSHGNLGGEGDGSPFRDEDVREWSRVDHITGMLERARVETDRWRANTHDAAHSYGKMIDSRERNSADGSLMQKARRQVEIFQSQGNSGRSFQVVRASQWSCSRATDSVLDIPITKPPDERPATETMTGGEVSPVPRVGLWRTNLERGTSDLEQLSSLCRELHDEAIRNTALWSTSIPEEVGALSERRSNSSEDVTSQPPTHELFTRDCRTRRSLQISQPVEEGRSRRPRNEFIAERARTFEEGAARTSRSSRTNRNGLGIRTFASIANNDFVKNDPKHPSKVNQVPIKVSLQDMGQQSNQRLHNGNAGEPSVRKANNKTVVHLRNAASPVQGDEDELPRCINVTAIKLDNEPEHRDESGLTLAPPEDQTTTSLAAKPVKKVEFCKTEVHFAADSGKVNIVETDGKPPPTNKFRRRRRNNHLGTSISSNNNIQIRDLKNYHAQLNTVHYVNYVPCGQQKNNMPLVHFGDTFYEKYIFGGQGKLLQEDKKIRIMSDNPVIENGKKNYNFGESEIKSERWHSSEKIKENGIVSSNEMSTANKDSNANLSQEKIVDHNNKHKGTHTTTVNFLNDESTTVSKVNQGVAGRRIQVQFASSNKNLSALASGGDGDENAGIVVTRTTKITLRLPAVISQHSRVLQCNPFSNLKSVRLVMSIGEMTASRNIHSDNSVSLKRFFSNLCNTEPQEGLSLKDPGTKDSSPHLWSLQLKSDEPQTGDDRLDEHPLVDRSRMITDKPNGVFPTTNNIAYKDDDSAERLAKKNQILTKDSENNQVLLKIVTTHKPVVARVENDHINHNPLKSRLKSQGANVQEESANKLLVEKNDKNKSQNAIRANLDAKDLCDNSNGINGMEAPTYENIFDAVSDGAPLYENFQVINSVPVKVKAVANGKPTVKKRSLNTQSEKSLGNSYERRHKKLSPKIDNTHEGSTEKSNKIKPDKGKSTRPAPSISSLSNAKSNKNSQLIDNVDFKSTNRTSSRLSNSRDNSTKRNKDTKSLKEDSTVSVQVKRKSSLKVDGVKPESKGSALSNNTRNNTAHTKSKKPVEVVYQTVVFNMKNEKLSKPAKTKESKGPRLINDLICGSKMRRPTDNKRITKTAIMSQNTSKRKEIPSTVNRS